MVQIRVGGLSEPRLPSRTSPRTTSPTCTPTEQLAAIFDALPALVERHENGPRRGRVAPSPSAASCASAPADYTDDDRAAVQRHFERRLAPIISPLIVDPRHPFPNLRNGRLFVACSLDGAEETGLLGIIEVPRTEQRVVVLPASPQGLALHAARGRP